MRWRARSPTLLTRGQGRHEDRGGRGLRTGPDRLPYRELGEAIDKINSAGHPLTLYWIGNDNDRLKRVADNTRSGSISGNDFALHLFSHGLPFGGVGRSGMATTTASSGSTPSATPARSPCRRCRSASLR